MDKNSYMELPYDLSGAMAKNRFKNEILWGMHKMMDIYTNDEDFSIIFDYVCDIEVHWENGKYEFYQIKTANAGEAYTQNKLTKVGRKNNSVFAKLYLLKNNYNGNKDKIELAIVSNKPFKDKNNKLYNTNSILNFSDLNNDIKAKIEMDICNELKIEKVDFKNIKFVYTTIDLINPKNTLTGELVNFFKDILGVEIKKPTVLYNVLLDIITQKAEYEMKANTYEELIKNKAVTKDKIKEIFQKHIEISNNSVKKARQTIEDIYKDDYGKRINMLVALSSIVSTYNTDKRIQKIEKEIIDFLNNNNDSLSTNLKNVIIDLKEKYKKGFNIEYSNDEIEAFIVLILMKREEEMYE